MSSKAGDTKEAHYAQKAASGTPATTPLKTIRTVSGPSINPGHVGPKNAPYMAKDAK